mgnify:CR=1 FL=1
MLMFKRTFWRNHVEDQDGKVIQQGTLLEQDQFNRMEVGISDSNMASKPLRTDVCRAHPSLPSNTDQHEKKRPRLARCGHDIRYP